MTSQDEFRAICLDLIPFALGLLEKDRQTLGISQDFADHTIAEIVCRYLEAPTHGTHCSNQIEKAH